MMEPGGGSGLLSGVDIISEGSLDGEGGTNTGSAEDDGVPDAGSGSLDGEGGTNTGSAEDDGVPDTGNADGVGMIKNGHGLLLLEKDACFVPDR